MPQDDDDDVARGWRVSEAALSEMESRLQTGGALKPEELKSLLMVTASGASLGTAVARRLASMIVESLDERFIPPLVSRLMRDPTCTHPETLSFLYALGEILEEADHAFANPREYFPPAFIQLLGEWLLKTDGGEVSWKACFVLHNIRVEEAYCYLRQAAVDERLLPQSRAQCLLALVNGRALGVEAILKLLSDDVDPAIRDAAARGRKWLLGHA